MEIGAPGQKVVRFGLYEADLQQRVLIKSGLRVRLQDQPFQVLALLLERPGELVTREEIQQRIWPADTYVAFDDGLNTAIKKLRSALSDTADNPRFIETVPRRGYRFVAPATFSALAVATAPVKLPDVPADRVLIAARERSRLVIESSPARSPRRWGYLAAVLILATGAGLHFYRPGHRGPPETSDAAVAKTAPTIKPRPSVAVMGFRNLSRGTAEVWLSTALAEMLNTELAAGERLRMVPGEQISRAKLDLSLIDTEALAKGTLLRLRSDVGADYVVLGSYTALGQAGKRRIRLDLRLQDTSAGETIAEEAVAGSEEDLFDLVSEAGTRLRMRFDIGALGGEDAVRVRASLPSNAEAARLYAEGLTKLRRFDALAARDLLTKAEAEDPKNAMIRTVLSSAWSRLGYDTRSQHEARQAFDLSDSLSREDRLLVEGRYREATHEWQKAVEIYHTLWNLFPDNLDYGLQLASTQTSGGLGKEALDTIAALRKLTDKSRTDPRIDLAEALAAGVLGDFPHAQQSAVAAVKAAEGQNSRLLIAKALHEEGEDWERVGQFEKAQDALQRSEALSAAAGDRGGAALTGLLLGELLVDHGDLAGARKVYESNLAACREIGHEKCKAYSLNNLGNLDRDQNNLVAAKKCYQQVLEIHQKIENRAGVGVALSNLGNVADDLGDLAEAENMRKQALDLFNEVGDGPGASSQMTNLAAVLAERGKFEAALGLVDQSISKNRALGVQRSLSFALTSRADILEQLDQLAEARRAEEEAFEIRKKLNTPEFLAMSLTQSASLFLDNNQPEAAEATATQAAKQIKNLKAFDLEATAYSLLARSLLAQGVLPAAQDAAARALASARQVAAHPPRFDAALAAAAVEAASGRAVEARKKLSAVLAESTKFGYVFYQYEARMALCEIDLKSSRSVSARVELAALEKDARSRGFNLIARKTAAVR
jgi:DNA-binding winged helix-turn-helix (wHTH) protein/tetratricopeptide (TPR) repeat protein